MVLEEYVDWLKQFDLAKNPLSVNRGNKETRIGYVKAEGQYTRVEGEESRIGISGNNVDGFILTCTMGKNGLSM